MKMDAGARGWMHKTATKNFWRVEHFCDYEDMIQEGYMCWWRVNRNYPLSRMPAIMGYFKLAFINEINRMSNKATAKNWLTYTDEPLRPGPLEGTGMLELLAHAPDAIRKAFRIFQSDEGARKLRAPYRLRSDGTRETTAERVNRISGMPEEDFEAILRAYLRS